MSVVRFQCRIEESRREHIFKYVRELWCWGPTKQGSSPTPHDSEANCCKSSPYCHVWDRFANHFTRWTTSEMDKDLRSQSRCSTGASCCCGIWSQSPSVHCSLHSVAHLQEAHGGTITDATTSGVGPILHPEHTPKRFFRKHGLGRKTSFRVGQIVTKTCQATCRGVGCYLLGN